MNEYADEYSEYGDAAPKPQNKRMNIPDMGAPPPCPRKGHDAP